MKKSNDGLEAYVGIAVLAVGFYTGLAMLSLLVVYFLMAQLGKKYLSSKAMPYVDTIAIQASLILIMVIYLYVLHSYQFLYISNLYALIITALTVVGLIWMIKNPSLNPAIMLTVFQFILIATGIIEMLEMEIGSDLHRAYANSVVWRVMGLLLLWRTYSLQNNNAVSMDSNVS